MFFKEKYLKMEERILCFEILLLMSCFIFRFLGKGINIVVFFINYLVKKLVVI